MAGLIHKWFARHHKPAPAFTDTEHRYIMDADWDGGVAECDDDIPFAPSWI